MIQSLAAWFSARLGGDGSHAGTNGGYWGGIVMRALAFMRRSAAKATAFLRR